MVCVFNIDDVCLSLRHLSDALDNAASSVFIVSVSVPESLSAFGTKRTRKYATTILQYKVYTWISYTDPISV